MKMMRIRRRERRVRALHLLPVLKIIGKGPNKMMPKPLVSFLLSASPLPEKLSSMRMNPATTERKPAANSVEATLNPSSQLKIRWNGCIKLLFPRLKPQSLKEPCVLHSEEVAYAVAVAASESLDGRAVFQDLSGN